MKKPKPQSEGIFIFMLLVVVFLFLAHFSPAHAGNNAGGAFSHWPDTGQTKCYDNTGEISCPDPGDPFYGQDAQYQGPQRSYTKLGYGGGELSDSATQEDGWIMTRDNVTGLIWEIKTDDGSIHDKDNYYTWCDDNSDTNGGYQGACDGSNDTKDFIAALNSANFGGYSDWRLPTIKELASLVNSNIPYLECAVVDKAYFPNMICSDYWSCTSDLDDNTWAFIVDMFNGTIRTHYKDNIFGFVIAVRSDKPISVPQFTDNHDGTITDRMNGLMWQKCTMGRTYDEFTEGCGAWTTATFNWKEALEACENCSLAGYNDWRLPNRNELLSIVDYSKSYPAVNTDYFPLSQYYYGYYWSSSTNSSYPEKAQAVDFGSGYVPCGEHSGFSKVGYHFYVRCVRSIEFLPGDSDGDGDVDGANAAGFADAYGSSPGDPNYVKAYNLDETPGIGEGDLVIFAEHFGENGF